MSYSKGEYKLTIDSNVFEFNSEILQNITSCQLVLENDGDIICYEDLTVQKQNDDSSYNNVVELPDEISADIYFDNAYIKLVDESGVEVRYYLIISSSDDEYDISSNEGIELIFNKDGKTVTMD